MDITSENIRQLAVQSKDILEFFHMWMTMENTQWLYVTYKMRPDVQKANAKIFKESLMCFVNTVCDNGMYDNARINAL